MNNTMHEAGEVMEMETKHVRGRRKPTPTAFEDAGLNVTEPPIQSVNNTEMAYNWTNNTLLGNGTSTNADQQYSDSETLLTILGPIFLLIFCTFCQRSNVPSSQYHRGEMFRRQAERVWAIQQVKNERQAIPVETRKTQIDESLCRMEIVSKCSRTGHCVLGPLEIEGETEPQPDDDKDTTGETTETTPEGVDCKGEVSSEPSTTTDALSDARSTGTEDELPPTPPSNTNSAASIGVAASAPSASKSCKKCPDSPGRNERRPLLSPDSEDSEDDFRYVEGTKESSQSCIKNSAATSAPTSAATSAKPAYYDDFEDDEDVCPICLDNFEVGDIVMFSRHNQSSCSHVFHEDCLLQWLLEQRENECPTCRASFIADLDTNSTSASSAETTENSTLEPGDTDSNESDGDIEEGIGNSSDSDTTLEENDNGGDCSFDLDEMADQKQKQEESPETDAINETEEGLTYIIVKGSVQRVSSLHDASS